MAERTIDVDGVEVFYRQVDGAGPPTLFVHGNPTNSADWLPFLERVDGPAVAPDLPGWGRSAQPRDFDYSMTGVANLLERFLEELGIGEYGLVVHDWGVLGLIPAQRHPDRLRNLVVTNAVPLDSTYRWHWVARYFWRVPVAGELFNLATTRTSTALGLRLTRPGNRPMPADFVEMIWRGRPGGVGRPILDLYRSADPQALGAAGRDLPRIGCPALVLWGQQDRFIPADFGRVYAERLPDAELVMLPDAGHWPWIDRPDSIDRVLGFLRRDA